MKNFVKLFGIISFLVIIGGIWTGCKEPEASVSSQPALTGTVSISGIAQVGQTLTADTSKLDGTWTISYQWKRGNTVVGTDSKTYIVQTADVGSVITVTVSRSGNSGSITSSPTAAVTNPSLPALTGTVTITGTAQVGQTITANTSSLGGSGTISYQWKRGNANIGINSSTYTVQSADVSSTITVTVTRSGNSSSVTSAATTAVILANQNPIVSDFDIINLTQTAGSVTPVTITPKAGKSNGAITIYYNGSTILPTVVGTYTVTFNVAASTGWNAVTGLAGGTLTIKKAQSFSITFNQIADTAPLIAGTTISRTGTGWSITETIGVDNPTQYNSIMWRINGIKITGIGSSFTLGLENTAYLILGNHHLMIEVIKDGVPYNKTVIFTIVE